MLSREVGCPGCVANLHTDPADFPDCPRCSGSGRVVERREIEVAVWFGSEEPDSLPGWQWGVVEQCIESDTTFKTEQAARADARETIQRTNPGWTLDPTADEEASS